MTQPRDAYHHGDLRNALVASAGRLIEAGGPGSFSLREAAREVGVSANAAYRHFDDKAALLGAVAADGFSQLAQRMKRAMDHAAGRRGEESPSVARFKAAGRSYVEFAIAHPELFRLMFGECGARCLPDHVAGPDDASPWTLLATSLDALVADRSMPAAGRPGAELKAWSAVHGFASLAIDGLDMAPSARARAAALEQLLAFVVRGLCAIDHSEVED